MRKNLCYMLDNSTSNKTTGTELKVRPFTNSLQCQQKFNYNKNNIQKIRGRRFYQTGKSDKMTTLKPEASRPQLLSLTIFFQKFPKL